MKRRAIKKIKSGVSITLITIGVVATINAVGAKKDAENAKFLVANYVDKEGFLVLPSREEIIPTHTIECSGKNVEREIYEQRVNCLIIGDTRFTEESKLVSKVTFHVSRKERIAAEEKLTYKGYYVFVEKEGYTLEGSYNVRYIDDYVTVYTDFDPAGEYADVKIPYCQIIEIMDVEVRRSHPFEELKEYNFCYEENNVEEKGYSFRLVPKDNK